ncbi:MAG TPA: PAS domain-containing sensor histidine kinase, partial [Deltaproteobacteria bacterium]|nr:PAS domain-containing sensor histidine kinase [Deltaproteobacteria bacterium]
AIEMALYKHKMERRLKEREEWLSTTLASIGDAVIATDMKGHIIFMNHVAEFLTQWKQEDAIGIPLKEIFKIVNEKTRKPVEDSVEKVLREGIIVGLANHTILIAKDETERPIDDSGAPIRDDKGNVMGVVLVFRDVSERRKTEHALRQSEERYRTLFEDSRDAIYITAREGMFVDANQSMLDLFGYSREEMIGLNARKIYVNSDDRNIFQKEIEPTGSVKEYEVKFCKKDGTKMDCLLTSSVRQDDDGSILGYQGVIHDITERKCIEAQLHQAQKLESIGTLAGGIAHDFNNLLMGIQGHASLISLDIDPHHPNFQHLNGIEAAVENGANLTRQLLGFARGGKYQTKVIDLNKLIQINSEMFGRTKKEINIHTKYQKDLWPVEVDPGQINQVMLNLYINAWQAMSRRGDLHIETSNVVINKNDAKSFKVKAGNYVKISVTDTGAGMDKATLQRIFDPFYTTKVMGRGTGLGLASAYGIIKNHGGIINVYSEKGSGTTFEIFLLASEKQVIIEEKPAAEILMGTQTILLVDDEDMILDVGEEMLRKLGYTVMLAKSGNEAVKAYKKHKDEIDLIILDMIMPDISGSEAYDIMKEINPKIKVLLSSGYSVNGEAKEILERGCDGFIQKPFNLTTLSRKIGEILDLS